MTKLLLPTVSEWVVYGLSKVLSEFETEEDYPCFRIYPTPYSLYTSRTLFPLACVVYVQTTILRLCVRLHREQHEIFLELQDFLWVISPLAIQLDKFSCGSALRPWITTKCPILPLLDSLGRLFHEIRPFSLASSGSG